MELEQIISQIDVLKAELDTLRPLREDHLSKLTQKLKLDWNYHSNSIEGNTLTRSETKSFILWGITAKGKPFRDYLEMKGHNNALNKLYSIVHKDLKITERLIKEFHEMILVEPFTSDDAEINPGVWKKFPNYLYSPTGERIDFVAPEEVPQRMNVLTNWLNNHIAPPKRKKNKYNLHPLLIAAGFHAEFLRIHPFGDGNGRMARILTNLILMLCGYVPAIIKLDNRKEYYTSINISSLEKPENLAVLLGREVLNSLKLAIKAAKGEELEEEEDIEQELQLIQLKINQRKANRTLKSTETLQQALNKSIFPFLGKMTQALEKYHNLFENSSYSINLNDGEKRYSLSSVRQTIFPIKEKEQVNQLEFSYNLNKLKDKNSSLDIKLKIKIEFLEYDFIVKDNLNSLQKTLDYGQDLSDKEQDQWILKIQRRMIEMIDDFV